MSRRKKISLSLALGLFLTVGVAWYIHTSTWFIWGILPENSTRFFVDLSGQNRAVFAAINQEYPFTQVFPFNFSEAVRFLYVPGQESIILPRLGRASAIMRSLRQRDWHPKRFGLLIIAEKGRRGVPVSPDNATLLKGGLRQVWQSLVWEHVPLRPLAAATVDPGKIRNVTNPFLRVISVRHGRDIHLAGVHEDENSWPSLENFSFPDQIPTGLKTTIPGPALNLLPEDQRKAWNEQFRTKFGLKRTQPDILAAVSHIPELMIEIHSESVTLAATGADQEFAQYVQSWFGEELAFGKPVSKAFLLPDRTLGYEKYPGEAPPVFPGLPAPGQCLKSQVWPNNLSLCQEDQSILLTTSPEGSSGSHHVSAKSKEVSWSLTAGPEFASRVSGLDIEQIAAWGNSRESHLVIRLLP